MGKIVNSETACLAKNNGFNVPVLNCYNPNNEIIDPNTLWNYGCEGGMRLEEWYVDYNSTDTITSVIGSAPTQSELQDWLREEHNINIYAYQPADTTGWVNNIENESLYISYEVALERGLQKALKLI